MSEVKLSARLAAAAEFVDIDRVICDVGTDHALIPCYLWKKGASRIIASDINEGPLFSAKETISRYIGECCNIELVLSDGTDKIPYADDVIICGMGGELIAEIVTRCKFTTKDTRFILQPMTKAEYLRTALYENGFEIAEEKTVLDGKLYVIMLARYTGVKQNISPAFSYIGKVCDKKYAEKQTTALRKAADGCKNSDSARAELFVKTADEIEKIMEQRNES